MFGLLDSGANRVFMNSEGWNALKRLGLKLQSSNTITCRVANDNECSCLGIVTVPVRLRDVVKVIDIFIIPQLRHKLVLGMDFWIRMGIVPDMIKGNGTFPKQNLVIRL